MKSIVTRMFYIFNAYIAFVLFYFKPKREKTWLIGGHNGQLYTDNAKVFYEYILAQHPEINIYWVVTKSAPAYDDIKGQKLIKGSVKAYLHFYVSEVTLFSDTLNSDIAPLSFVLPGVKKLYNKTCKVYLSHGSIAFKKMPQQQGLLAQLKRDIFKSYTLAIASSSLSKKAMISYGMEPSHIVMAGSARNDALKNVKTQHKTVLIAPTWRPWMQNGTDFVNSDFFRYYSALLSDVKLLDYLEKESIKLHFYLHHMFHDYKTYFEKFENTSITILSPNVNVGQEIMTASLMITDYSSMSADFYYLQKPVLFFQFDRETFLLEVGSEIDLKKDTFGEVSFTVSALIENLIYTVKNDYILSPLQKEGEAYFMHFTDKKNCLRIYSAIRHELKKDLYEV